MSTTAAGRKIADMTPTEYPGGLGELEFVQAYCDGTLRKPQVVSDTVMRSSVLASAGDRLLLSALLAEQLAEACRRIAAVYTALADRRSPVAASLLAPLPGLDGWRAFTQQAGTLTPQQILRDLSLDESALDAATKLRAQPSLAEFDRLVAIAESGASMFLVPPGDTRRVPSEIHYAGALSSGETVTVVLGALEGDSAELADITADLSSISRSFLQSYIDARRLAGRRA